MALCGLCKVGSITLNFTQGYKEKIADIREEILRKRRAGKLPGDTTSLLKAWWQSHSKWPYPTVSVSIFKFALVTGTRFMGASYDACLAFI